MTLEWIAENIRISLFSNEVVTLTNNDWKKVTGQEEPESQQKVLGRHTMSAPFQSGFLTITASGTRIDCVLSPKPRKEVEEGYLPSLGDWPAACGAFLSATKQWVGQLSSPIVRIAFGAVLLNRCPTRREAYTSLIGLLKSVNGDAGRMRELIYRINWPIESNSVPGLTLNRITQWAVLELRTQIMMIAPGSPVIEQSAAPIFVIRLELDHNTDEGWMNPFDRDSRDLIYEELVQMALENAEKGELK